MYLIRIYSIYLRHKTTIYHPVTSMTDLIKFMQHKIKEYFIIILVLIRTFVRN